MDYIEIFKLILDENDFTVGGGCASAISGAMACGLAGMVANLSKGKDYGYSDEEYDNIIKELNELKSELIKGSVEDNKAYLLIRDAYRLPKSTEEEKAIRKEAIQNAGIEAASVPLKNALLNKKVYDIAMKLRPNSNPSCGTDLDAGINLSKLGMDAGKANVEVNLPLIKDKKIVEDFKSRVCKLEI